MEVVSSRDEGKVTIISIERPAKRNALSSQVAVELQQAFAAFDRSDQAAAILRGSGEHFTAGADLANPPEFWRCVPTIGITTNKPVIAAVEGWCVGGGVVIAMMADFCVASEAATFWYPEAGLGISGGMIAGLAARIPHKAAMEMMVLARKIPGRRAYEMGLVNELVPAGETLTAALRMGEELSALAPLVLSSLKRAVNETILPRSPAEMAGTIARDQDVIRNSADAAEGRAASREKRKPRFVGR